MFFTKIDTNNSFFLMEAKFKWDKCLYLVVNKFRGVASKGISEYHKFLEQTFTASNLNKEKEQIHRWLQNFIDTIH